MSSDPTPNHPENLTALYQETWGEIHRLRDLEWKIAYSFLTLSAGLIALLTTDVVRALLSLRIRWMLTAVQVLSAIFAFYYLRQTHNYLTQQRNIRRRIEEVLGFFGNEKLGTRPILPQEWKGKEVTNRFQMADLIVPLALMVLVVGGFSIFVIWRLKAG